MRLSNQFTVTVTICEHATMALSLLREKRGGYDVVLTDVHMPDVDGFKLLEIIGLEMDLPVVSESLESWCYLLVLCLISILGFLYL